MRDLATHYRVAKVDTALGRFVGEVVDYWANDTVMTKLLYDETGNREGPIEMKDAYGHRKLIGQYAKGKKIGPWEIDKGSPLSTDFSDGSVKSNQTIDSLEMRLTWKEQFNVSQYIRKSEYSTIYPLVSRSHSSHINKEGVFSPVEERAQFPNGMEALGRFISAYINYPEEALRNKRKGQVIVEFTITEDGSTTDFKVIKSLGSGCDEEAIRVLKLLPDWVPAYQRGKAVRTKFRLPISFG